MKAKQKLLAQIIASLNNEPDKWVFGEYTADNSEWGISLWTRNGMTCLSVHKPHKIKFSLFQQIRLHRAITKCKAVKLLKS